jgi:hypothetical protein
MPHKVSDNLSRRVGAFVLVIVSLALIALGGLLIARTSDVPPGMIVAALGALGLYTVFRHGKRRGGGRRARREPSDAFEMLSRHRSDIDYDFQRRARGEFDAARPSDPLDETRPD